MRIIGGSFRGRRLVAPPGKGTRPPLDRQRETLFNLLGQHLEGLDVLDLFAGTGSLGLEALSRGARRVLFVEADPRAAAALRENVQHLGAAERVEVIRGDALRIPAPCAGPFDLVFVDPPFPLLGRGAGARRLWERVRALGDALGPGGRLVLRLPARSRPPPSPGLRLVAERTVGDAAFFILAREEERS